MGENLLNIIALKKIKRNNNGKQEKEKIEKMLNFQLIFKFIQLKYKLNKLICILFQIFLWGDQLTHF